MARFSINEEAIADIAWNGFISPGSALAAALVERAVEEAPGSMAEGITLEEVGRRTAHLTSTHPAVTFVIFGHGPLVPTGNYGGNGLYMTWISKLGERVFAKNVRAVEPNNFLLRACLAVGLRAR